MYQETCTYWKTGGEESAKGIESIQLCQGDDTKGSPSISHRVSHVATRQLYCQTTVARL